MKAQTELQFVVGPMRRTEAAPLSSLFADVLMALSYYNEAAKRAEWAKYSAERLQHNAEADGDSVLVAMAGNEIAGFCFNHYDDGLIWIDWFGVSVRHRHQGVASALLRELEARARRRSIHKIWCDCRTENDGSKHVLTRHSYRQICTVQNHWYGQDFILWEKLLQ